MRDRGSTKGLIEVRENLRWTVGREMRNPPEVRLVDQREAVIPIDRAPRGSLLRWGLFSGRPEELDDGAQHFSRVHASLHGRRYNEPCARRVRRRILSAISPNLFILRTPPSGRGEKQTRLGNVTSVKEELAPHVHDITRVLGNKVSEQEIERELSSYLNVYRVSLDTAKRSIVKKHGGNRASLAVGVSKTLRDLNPGEQSVNLLVRIVSVNEKDVTVEGGTKRILYGILGDPSATMPFTAWEPLPIPIAKGDVVRVQNAYTKEYRGQGQGNFGVRRAGGKG